MKKQAARTIATLSLLITLSVVASNVSAFPTGCGGRCQSVQYAATVPVQTTNPTSVETPAPRAALRQTQPERSDGVFALFWVRLVSMFSSLV